MSSTDLIADLRVPPEFAKYDEQTDTEIIVRLEQWKQRTCETLEALRDHLQSGKAADAQTQAEVLYTVSAFDGEGSWVDDPSRNVAREILSSAFAEPSVDILERILRDFVKPFFATNPHPNINPETGRKLARPAGGPLGHLDYLEGQEWKLHPELYNVLAWCLRHSESRAVERLWHLFLPPMMTCLDDYQAAYKLQGVRLVAIMLDRAPADLWRRTGVDALLNGSLKTCLSFLHNPETPELIRVSVSAYILLVTTTTTLGSAARFEQLCSLLGDSIIGNIWVYASREIDTLQASLDALPEILEVLDVGSTRYLKALVPQLVFPVIPTPENDTTVAYKLASVRALSTVIRVCRSRIYKWRGTILEAVLKCWVNLVDQKSTDAEITTLRAELQSVCVTLGSACCSVVPDFRAQRLLSLDAALFAPILSPLLVEGASV
ncbi:hypothetical protein C8Q77DRAFT_1047712 [Trametes polyzona]|nr:hypothetical protein C8Q77DRAFT_1047712 [Trametes polyzona]